jgi:putative hydrolase of the HAD superfamily
VSLRAVVWDMGGILYVTPFEAAAELEAANGLAPGILPRGPFADGDDRGYAEVDAGALPEPEYWRRWRQNLLTAGIDVDVHRDILWEGRERAEVFRVLHVIAESRYRQGLLTNDASAFLGPDWQSRWSWSHLFDATVDSVDIGVRKPHPDAYRAAADALRVAVEECLFVDDLTVNVDAARAAGMAALRFDVMDPAGSAVAILRRIGLGPTGGSRSQAADAGHSRRPS